MTKKVGIMAKRKWKKSTYPGVRYREHETRRHGVGPDKYFAIRYQLAGKRKEEGLGWASQGWTVKKAVLELERLRENAKTGKGPVRLEEKREAAQKARDEADAAKDQVERDQFTFGELMGEYLEWARTNKKHWADDESRYRTHLEARLGPVPLKEINPFLLEKLKRSLEKKGLAAATVKHCLVIVRQAFNKAVVWGRYDGANPIKGVKLPKVDNAKIRALITEEEELLLPALKARSFEVHDMAMVSLYAGLRFSEVAQIRWRDVYFDQGLLGVEGKGSKRRTVPMNQTVGNVLKDRKSTAHKPDDLIFPDRIGNIQLQISRTYFRVVKALGFNTDVDRRHRVDFHTLRHTYATRLATNGTPLTVLRDLLGHTDLTMTSRYAHVMPGQAADAVRGLDAPTKKVVKLRKA